MKEKDLYGPVLRYAERSLGCFATKSDTGLKAGRIDVVGLRDIGGSLDGSGEIIAIEVKRGAQPFLTAVGQAMAYSVYADRCYLADIRERGFTDDEKTIALRLGAGLLRLRVGKRTVVTEEMTAPIGSPLARFRLELVEKLGFSLCTICTSFFQRGSDSNFRAGVVARNSAGTHRNRAVELGRGLMYWLEEQDFRARRDLDTFRTRRYVCASCTAALFG